jgi:hypothetical protein
LGDGAIGLKLAPCILSVILIGVTAFYLRTLPPPAEEPDDFIAAVLPPLRDYRPMYPWFCQNEHCGRVMETETPFDKPAACTSCGSPMASVSLGELTILPPDTGFRKCHYYDALGDVYRVTVVINGKSRQSIHRPEVCLPSQGFSLENGRVVEFRLANGGTLPMRCVDLRRREAVSSLRMGQGYFFVSRHNLVASHVSRMFISVRDRAFHNRITRWAMVTLFCEEPLASTPARQAAVAAFLSQLNDALIKNAATGKGDGN